MEVAFVRRSHKDEDGVNRSRRFGKSDAILATSEEDAERMLLRRPFSSLMYNSLPAKKAMNPSANSSTKRRFSTASFEINPSTWGPAMMPIKRKPVIRGRFAFVKSPPTCLEARAITVKAAMISTISGSLPRSAAFRQLKSEHLC
jgi:hypothetical protein